MLKTKWFNIFLFFISIFIFHFGYTQTSAPTPAIANPAPAPTTPSTTTAAADSSGEKMVFEELDEGGGTTLKLLNGLPSKKRIRRHLNLIAGVKHDEEFLLPEIPLSYKGNVDLLDIQRIKGTDVFRIFPPRVGNGIITVHNKKTGQILVELRIDIRDQTIERTLREIQALLSDIEGIEYKIVNGRILLDGFVLLPKDLRRIGNVIAQFNEGGAANISSLVGLSPIAKKKIVEYIARDINNPEIVITSIGDFIKLEGFVNTQAEKDRIKQVAELYLPDIVTDEGYKRAVLSVSVTDRKQSGAIDNYIINLIQIRPTEDKVEPPPKMLQIVIHVVEYSERYLKSFDFTFSPSLQGLAQGQEQQRAPGSISEIAGIVNNLLPKLNWARSHGFVRLLDTASLLVQDKGLKPDARGGQASISRTFNVSNGSVTAGGQPMPGPAYTMSFDVNNATIKSERSELVEMELAVSTGNTILSLATPTTRVQTKVSVRSRQSAALAGIITKKSENEFGGPTGAGAIVTLNHGKKFQKASSNYVLFVTPIVKSSASSGVDQVKKKFRLKE